MDFGMKRMVVRGAIVLRGVWDGEGEVEGARAAVVRGTVVEGG